MTSQSKYIVQMEDSMFSDTWHDMEIYETAQEGMAIDQLEYLVKGLPSRNLRLILRHTTTTEEIIRTKI